jgi:hypothetical protein
MEEAAADEESARSVEDALAIRAIQARLPDSSLVSTSSDPLDRLERRGERA